MKNRQKIIVGAVILIAALFVATDLSAQTATTIALLPPKHPIRQIPVLVNNPAAAELVSNLLEAPLPELSVPVISRFNRELVGGTFWTITQAAPLPFNPFPELPLYQIGTNQYVIDDRSVDYAALKTLSAMASRSSLMTLDSVSPLSPGDGSGDVSGYSYDASTFTYTLPPGLKITPPVFTNGNVSVSIYEQDPSLPYAIFYCTNLLPAIQWNLASQGSVGQTNFVFANSFGGSQTVFFITASTADMDGDGLSDGYEALVSHTNPANADTDGDGMSDGWEIAHGLNPLVSNQPYTPPATTLTITKPINRAVIP